MECLNSEKEEIEIENIYSIVLLQPKDGQITDEESDNDEEGNLEHFTPGQIQSKAEVIYKSNEKSEKRVKTSKNGTKQKCLKDI